MSAAVRTIRNRAARFGYRLVVNGGTGELYSADGLVRPSAPLEVVNAWLVERISQERRPPGPAPQPVPSEWRALIDGYRAELMAARRTEGTISTRMSHLATFARTIETSPEDVTRDQLKAYLGRR